MENELEDAQYLYINMDDSGQLVKNSPNELVFVYGGVYFLSLEEQENFTRQYRAIVNSIKPDYCKAFQRNNTLNKQHCLYHNYRNCMYKCPELKSSMLERADRRRLLNFIKKYNTSVAVVTNNNLRIPIEDKATKGRYKDYVTKLEVKRIVQNLISQNRINPNKHLKIILNMDEQPTISNGYYELDKSIKEELQFGISNYDYGITFKPIVKSVDIKTSYKDSYYYLPVQAADLLVGEVRHRYYDYLQTQDFETYKKRTKFLDTSIYLP